MKFPDFSYIFRKYLKKIKLFILKPSQKLLAESKLEQKEKFNKLKTKLTDLYLKVKIGDIDHFLTPFWKQKEEQLEKEMIYDTPFSFLRNSDICYTMFVSAGGKWLKSELKYLEKNISQVMLKKLLIEDYIGEPLLMNSKYLTSHNSIHHLYHFVKFLNITGTKLDEIDTIIEWGGGYGNMAKILSRFTYNNNTYIIIDIPLMSCIQWIYLTAILGPENVNLIQNSDEKIINGKINLLPISFLERYTINGDLFISTWAITESSKYSQDYVLKLNWFNCNHILLSYCSKSKIKFPTNLIQNVENDKNFIIENIEFLPNNKYAFQ